MVPALVRLHHVRGAGRARGDVHGAELGAAVLGEAAGGVFERVFVGGVLSGAFGGGGGEAE